MTTIVEFLWPSQPEHCFGTWVKIFARIGGKCMWSHEISAQFSWKPPSQTGLLLTTAPNCMLHHEVGRGTVPSRYVLYSSATISCKFSFHFACQLGGSLARSDWKYVRVGGNSREAAKSPPSSHKIAVYFHQGTSTRPFLSGEGACLGDYMYYRVPSLPEVLRIFCWHVMN